MVPKTGLEPVRPHGQRILSPLRLPFRHSGMLSGIATFQTNYFAAVSRGNRFGSPGGSRRYRTFILEFFRLALRPHKLSTHINDRTFLNSLNIFTGSQFPIVATGIVYRSISWCSWRDSNSHADGHWNLNPTCLPIPPQEHMVGRVGVEPTIPEGAGFTVQCVCRFATYPY